MLISDLTGTTWTINSSVTATSGQFRSSNIAFTVNYGDEWNEIRIGYYAYHHDLVASADRACGFNVTVGFYFNLENTTITFTGGTDATNSTLISWLEANATNVTPEPTPTENILTPKEQFFKNMNDLAQSIIDKAGLAAGLKTLQELKEAVDDIVVAQESERRTLSLNMASGDQVVNPTDADKVMTQVTITKPSTFLASNIKDDIEIGGITGTFTDSTTVSTGQTAAAAGQLLIGYSAWVNGVEIQGTIPVYTGGIVTTE
jgi:hypothetical protein